MQFALPTWSWQGGTPKHHRSLHKSLTSRLPPFCCEKLLRDQPSWSLVCIPLPITTQKLQKSPKCDWPHTIQNVVHKGLIILKRQPSSAPGTGKRKKRSRGRQLWRIQLLGKAVWWMASTGNNERPWETGFCSQVPALSPLTCPTDLYAGAHGRDALALCKLKPSTLTPAKGLLPAVIPLPSISIQSGQMVTGLEVESWTLEDKASNLQIRSRISTNQLHRKLKSWGMGVGTCFSLKRTASKQLHPGGYLRHIINLCSQGYFPIQSSKREVLRIWWNAAYSSHNCGCEGQAWAHGVTTCLTHSGLRILIHKTFQSFLPCLVMRALLKHVNLNMQ